MNRTPSEDGSPTQRRFWPWPGMIFALLAANVAIVTTTMVLATSDESFAVEPGYDRKAINWDQVAAQRARNAELGWRVIVGPAPAGSPIVARLLNAAGQPISGARVEVVAFHNAHAGNRLDTVLEQLDPGLYRSIEALMRPGSWELRCTVHAAGETYTQTVPHVVMSRVRADEERSP